MAVLGQQIHVGMALGSHCCCLYRKDIPLEIPLLPTNWSRLAMEARVLAERYVGHHRDNCCAGTFLAHAHGW